MSDSNAMATRHGVESTLRLQGIIHDDVDVKQFH